MARERVGGADSQKKIRRDLGREEIMERKRKEDFSGQQLSNPVTQPDME